MSKSSPSKEMAPKRRRMMDMILSLGGLREEEAIPLSKIKQEMENLKQDLDPLVGTILDFPNSYFNAFESMAQRNEFLEKVKEKSVLIDAINDLEQSIDEMKIDGVPELLTLLKTRKEALEPRKSDHTETVVMDIESELERISELAKRLSSNVDTLEEQAKIEAEEATRELEAIVEEFHEIKNNMESDPVSTLETLQKLGPKTRYGPFMRTAAQIKRGKQDGRIEDERFAELVYNNIMFEFRRALIMYILNNIGSKTVVEMSRMLETCPEGIQNAIVSMISRGEAEMVGLDDNYPVFSRVVDKQPETTLILKRSIQQLRSTLKALSDERVTLIEKSLEQLEGTLSRLNRLGDYDTSLLSDSIKELEEISGKIIETSLAAQTDDESEDLRLLVSAGLEAFAKFRLKITLEKGPNLVSGLNVYGEKLDPEVYERMLSNYLDSELERGAILILIRELGAMTTEDLAKETKIPQDRILQHLLRMKRDELLIVAGERNGYVLFDIPRTLNAAEQTIQLVSSLANQLASASTELNKILSDLDPQSIGRLVNSLETFSKARDKLEGIKIDGERPQSQLLHDIEDKIKSALLLSYRTRARIPSTRPKVTIEDLVDIDVPSVMADYRDNMGYAPLLGFGTVEWNHSRCLGCKSCEISCPEDAIELKPRLKISEFFEFSKEALDELPVNRAVFYDSVRSLATHKPNIDIELEKEAPGFGTVEVDLWLCVACRTCVRRCPGPQEGALELELKWNLPEVVSKMTAKS